MNTLHILVPTHVMPDVKSVTTMFFDNLLGALKKKTNVHVTWLVYTPEKFTLPKEENSDITILDIHDFKNAIEVLHKVKPDIIYASPSSRNWHLLTKDNEKFLTNGLKLLFKEDILIINK